MSNLIPRLTVYPVISAWGTNFEVVAYITSASIFGFNYTNFEVVDIVDWTHRVKFRPCNLVNRELDSQLKGRGFESRLIQH